MTVETAVYINTLNGSNPSPTDLKSEGDDHIRLVKTVLQNTLPNITAPVTATAAGLNAASSVALSGTFPGVPITGVTSVTSTGTGAAFSASSANAAGVNTISVSNTSPTGASAGAALVLSVSGISAGDPYVLFDSSGVGDWSAGIDNSDGQKFKISRASGLGTSDLLVLDTTGRLSVAGLHNNATLPSGTALQFIASGTYTPTLTNVQNFSAITSLASQWMRVGNVVTVSGSFNATAAASVTVVMGISLPIPSTLGTTGALSGAMPSWNGSTSPGGVTGFVRGDTTNNRANGVVLNDGFNGAGTWGFHFTYVVL